MQPSTANVGGQHTHFTEPETTVVSCIILLQHLSGETLQYATANNEDGAHADVSASEF